MKHFRSFGAAIFILLCVGAWYVWVLPRLLALPDTFSYSAAVQSYDNFYDPVAGKYPGEQQSATTFSYTTTKVAGKTLTIDNTFDVKTLSGDPIFTVTRTYTVDALSGKHVDVGTGRARDGYLFAPRMKGPAAEVSDRAPFTYWHVNYDVPAPMEYRDTTTLYGLSVYHYVGTFTADQTKELTGVLPGVGTDTGISLTVALQLWVEPYTGRIIQYRDDTEAFYYDLGTGAHIYPWNKFHNQTDPSSAAVQTKNINLLKEQFLLFEYVVPGVLLAAALLIILAPYLLAVFRRFTGSYAKRSALPFWSAFVVLIFTALAVSVVSGIAAQRLQADFTVAADTVSTSITSQLNVYANALRGGRGLFEASNSVNRDEWATYIKGLDITRTYPGVQGIGFGAVVTPSTHTEYVDTVRADGFTNFAIFPTTTEAIQVPVTYIEPFDERNQRAFGYDMWSEQNRRTAMAYARDANDVGITGLVVLKQENGVDEQPGFLMYEPVYKPTTASDAPESRRTGIFGYVYAAFRARDFMNGVFARVPTALGVAVYDSADPAQLDAEHLLYANAAALDSAPFEELQTITVYNRTWTVRYTASSAFGADAITDSLPWIIGIAGVLLALGAFFLVRVLNTRRVEALALAERMTSDLRISRDELEKTKQQVEEKLNETERLNKLMVNRELKMVELKEKLKKFNS